MFKLNDGEQEIDVAKVRFDETGGYLFIQNNGEYIILDDGLIVEMAVNLVMCFANSSVNVGYDVFKAKARLVE